MKANPDLIVYYDPINLQENWIRGLLKQISLAGNTAKTVYLSCSGIPSPDDFSFILVGEPELTFDLFLRERRYTEKQTTFHDTGVVDLNTLPLPDKSLFARHVDFKDSYMVFTSKGCPCHCSYCVETVFKDMLGAHYCRRRLPEHVLAELQEAKRRYGIREVIFKDSIFALNKDWLREYLPGYRKHINLPFKCFAKAGNFDAEMAGMLKESRCYCVEFGIQTFNESLKKNILSREEKSATLLAAFDICEQHNLNYDADHLFGIPGESLADHLTAAGIYSNLRCLNRIKCHNLVFYPKAAISEYAPATIKDDRHHPADFFSSVAGSRDMRPINGCFQKYFKVLPLLSNAGNAFLQKKARWKIFKFIPTGLIWTAMLVLAVKNKDKRFIIYLKYYPRKIFRTLME